MTGTWRKLKNKALKNTKLLIIKIIKIGRRIIKVGRKKLEWYPGAIYHVTASGNRRSEIFREEIDYELYLKYMGQALGHYKDCYRIISYCLMTNHVHIQYRSKRKTYKFLYW